MSAPAARTSVVARALMVVALAAAISAGAVTQAVAAGRVPTASDQGQGSIGVRLVDVPEQALADPRARSYIIDELAPGTTVQRRVEISSTSDAPVDVAVYASAAGITDGSFIGADGQTANGLSSWTSLDRPTVALGAGAVATVMVTVAVPADAPPGEQYAVIWAQVAAPSDGGVVVVNRVGVRMYVAVSGDNPLASAFTVDSMTASRGADGAAEVRVQVHNTGGRALDLSGSLSMVRSTGTVSVGPYTATLDPTLAPGESTSVAFAVTDQVDDGPWDATVDLASGVTTGSYTGQVSFAGANGGAYAAPVETTDGAEGPPVTWLAAGAALLALLVCVVLVLRRRRRQRRRVAGPRH